MNLSILAQTHTSDTSAVFWIAIALAVVLINMAACWRVFQKAKQPGWAALVPIYNIYVELKIIGRPGWWIWLYFIPFVNTITHLIVAMDLAKVFRKSNLFGVVSLLLLPPIGYAILGFGSARYRGVPKR